MNREAWCSLWLADPTFFTVIDSYSIELIFPIREGRSEQQIGKKGRDKSLWSVGINFCWLFNEFCRVVAWDWGTMNVYDKHFHPIVKTFVGKTIVLAGYSFRDLKLDPTFIIWVAGKDSISEIALSANGAGKPLNIKEQKNWFPRGWMLTNGLCYLRVGGRGLCLGAEKTRS